jgi:hypothetical protein
MQALNHSLTRGQKLVTVAAAVAAPVVTRAQSGGFDVSTLYSGASAAFGAAAIVAGGFLAIKFGAKMVKKAWAWLT